MEIRYYPGVGARNGLMEKYIGGRLCFLFTFTSLHHQHHADMYLGGLAAREVISTIIDAISDLATNYRAGDAIVVLGYSRG